VEQTLQRLRHVAALLDNYFHPSNTGRAIMQSILLGRPQFQEMLCQVVLYCSNKCKQRELLVLNGLLLYIRKNDLRALDCNENLLLE